jgi:prolyl 4-hydroxylase
MKLPTGNLNMADLTDLIHVHPNSLEDQICDYLINFFEENTNHHERIDNNKRPNFTQLNLTEVHQLDENLENIHNYIVQKVIHHRDLYYEYVDERVFPTSHAFEQLRIKKYEPNGVDQFDTHVDVIDYDSAKRYLSFMWYLNDVNDGGKTLFKDYSITPKKGTLLVFPPLWMYPHKGEPPTDGSKYLLSTYLHYT